MMPVASRPAPLDAGAFPDRVMAAIAELPLPTPTRNFASALRAGAACDAASAIFVAWHLATVRSWRVAPRVRARSFALVFAVVAMLATGSLATAEAVRVVAPFRVPHGQLDGRGSNVLTPVVVQPSPTAEPTRSLPVVAPLADPGGGDSASPIAGANDGPADGDLPVRANPGDHASGDDGDRAPGAGGGDHASDDGALPRETPEPDRASGGDAPAASSEPDHESGGGSPSETPEPSSAPDGGGSGPHE